MLIGLAIAVAVVALVAVRELLRDAVTGGARPFDEALVERRAPARVPAALARTEHVVDRAVRSRDFSELEARLAALADRLGSDAPRRPVGSLDDLEAALDELERR